MGDLFAVLAGLCWTGANITIARGAGGKGEDNGAFQSILLTAALAALVWVVGGWGDGWIAPSASASAWFALAGALTIFVGRVFFHSSIQRLGAVRGASVKRLQPLFSVLFGVVLLGEPVGWALAAGMTCIFAGLGLLVVESLSRSRVAAAAGTPSHGETRPPAWASMGLVVGAISALAYALGNVARKYGLDEMSDPAFGALLGSLVGAALFVVTAGFVGSYRQAVRSTFTRFNPWLFTAGLLSSAGQLLFFVAIDHGTVSRAALIVSLEVFVTIGLTRVFLRGREPLTTMAIVAALLGVGGSVVIMLDRGDAARLHANTASTSDTLTTDTAVDTATLAVVTDSATA